MKRYFYFYKDVDFNARDYYFWTWGSVTGMIEVYKKSGEIRNVSPYTYLEREVLDCLERKVWIEIPEAEAVLMM